MPASPSPYGGLSLIGGRVSSVGALLLALGCARLARFEPVAGGCLRQHRQLSLCLDLLGRLDRQAAISLTLVGYLRCSCHSGALEPDGRPGHRGVRTVYPDQPAWHPLTRARSALPHPAQAGSAVVGRPAWRAPSYPRTSEPASLLGGDYVQAIATMALLHLRGKRTGDFGDRERGRQRLVGSCAFVHSLWALYGTGEQAVFHGHRFPPGGSAAGGWKCLPS